MAPFGVSLAPTDVALEPNPTWQRIDTVYNVTGWSIDRGRPNEMSRTDTGTAQIELVDQSGDFDPTNEAGAFYGLLEPGVPMGPLVQAAIALENPVTALWTTLFRGFISKLDWVPYVTEGHANVTIDLVDALAIFAAAEMADNPGRLWGDDFVDGNIVFNERLALTAVQDRINQVLDQFGWDPSLRTIFTGNVQLQKTVYAPRSTVLQVMQDAADAEFPDVSNIYIGGPRNPGMVVFHGRLARFHPDVAEYQIAHWQLGDDTAAAVDPANVVRVSPPLTASLDDQTLFTSALAAPQNIADGDLAGQYVENAAAAAQKGLRTWSAENLATRGGLTATGNEETRLFADYVRDNYGTPRVRVGQLTVKTKLPSSVNGAATWRLFGNVDISDLVHLTTTHGASLGGFDDDFYVEGIHYVARPGPGFPLIELVLDVSPRGYYDANPFG